MVQGKRPFSHDHGMITETITWLSICSMTSIPWLVMGRAMAVTLKLFERCQHVLDFLEEKTSDKCRRWQIVRIRPAGKKWPIAISMLILQIFHANNCDWSTILYFPSCIFKFQLLYLPGFELRINWGKSKLSSQKAQKNRLKMSILPFNPYQDHEIPCRACQDHGSRAITILAFARLCFIIVFNISIKIIYISSIFYRYFFKESSIIQPWSLDVSQVSRS